MAIAGKRKIYLRADADSKIGYGHFMRTLALAEVLSTNFDCIFVTQSPSAFQKECLMDVCELIELPPDVTRFTLFSEMVENGDIVVLDNYFYDSEYENLLRSKGAVVVLIDNLHARHSNADVIIGFSIGLKAESYSIEPYTKLYLGPSYSLLREPFICQIAKKHPPIKDKNNIKVVISFGGADRKRIAVSIADMLDNSPNVSEITVIGNYSRGELSNNSSKIKLKTNLTANEMRDAFMSNDVAILPASTTTLEAIACSIPIIGGYFMDNQIYNYHQYVDSGAIIGCGSFNKRTNLLKVKEIIENGTFGYSHLSQSIIPVNLKKNLLSIFEAL